MRKQDHQSHGESRRQFLTSSGLVLGGLALPRLPFVTPAAAAQTTVKFAGWAFEPQVVEANLKRFTEQNPDVKVDYTPLDLQLYNEKMVALFNAGSQGDAPSISAIPISAPGSRRDGCSRSTACRG